MSRYIDADALSKEIESLSVHITGLRAEKGVLTNFMKEYRKSVLKTIDEQPTAYDVEKVLEQLKDTGYDDELLQEHLVRDIVKRGGVE